MNIKIKKRLKFKYGLKSFLYVLKSYLIEYCLILTISSKENIIISKNLYKTVLQKSLINNTYNFHIKEKDRINL